MYGKIVGKGPPIEGISKKTGKPYHGQTLYLLCEKRGIEGHAAMKQFVNFIGMDKPPVFKLGDDVFMDFDEEGYMNSLDVVAPEK